jgi:DNA polymerase I-like protein with 3'-5' exonuclease and polymerase domains
MLKFWTAADTPLIKKTLGVSLRNFRPDIPPHQFIPFEEDSPPPLPGAGNIVVVCGNKPLDLLRRHALAPKNRTLSSLREKPIAAGGGHYLVTFDPFITSNEPDKQEVIDWDVRLAHRLMTSGSLEPVVGEYRWVNSYQPMIDWIEQRHAVSGKPVDVSMDTETMTFYPWYPDRDIVTIQFTARPNTAEMLYLGPLKPPVPFDPKIDLFSQIEWLLTSPKVKLRMANGKFDLVWIAEKWGIECTNFKFDICLVGNLLNENRSNSLNLLTKVMTPLGGYDDSFNAKFDKGRMEAIPPEALTVYAGGDTDACQQVADAMRDELAEDPQLATFYIKILHPAARAFEKIERRGVAVDVERYKALREEVSEVIETSQQKAMELLPQRMKIKYRERIDNQLKQAKSPLLPTILKEYFFTPHGLNLKPKLRTEKTGEPSMQKSHLKMFGDVPEAMAMVEALTAMDTASKTRSTFIDGFLKHLRPDGRFHPSYMLFHGGLYDDEDDESGTVTGRLSAKEPPFQIIPKKTFWAKKIRQCFPAPPGKVVLSLDYSQGELRVVACVANEKAMITAYEQGLDLHAVTGAQLGGVPYAEFMAWKDNDNAKLAKMFEDLRQQAKAGNFGLLYGMGVDGFQAYAWANYGLKLSHAEAEKIRNDFFELYAGLLNYHERQRDVVRMTEMVRSPLGRVRHLPMIRAWDRAIKSKAERQSINSPIQSCLSDMMIWAIALIDDAYPAGGIEVVGMIHDALIAYVPEQDVHLWAGRAREIMSNLPFHEVGWKPVLQFPADAESGPTLAELKKLKLAA